MSDDCTLVIGAGAAGLAAARMLEDEGHEAIVLEARIRLGGRVQTSFDIADHPVELGAEFIHGENVCTWKLLERFGLNSIDIHPKLDVCAFVDGQLLDQESFLRMPNASLAMKTPYVAKTWMDGGGPDMSLAEAASDWAGFYEGDPTPGQLRLWHNLISQLQAADPSEVGVGGLVEASHEGDGGLILFRITEGYSVLMEALATGIDVRLECPVRRIEWSRDAVVASTDAGRFEARRAIVTVPLAVLKAGDVVFHPALPAQKVAAIEGLGAGPIAKIVVRFDDRFWPEGMTNLFTTLDSQGWWASGAGRDNEAPVLTSLLGGSAVGRLGAHGDPAAEGVHHLEHVFGRSLANRVVEARWIDWSADPWSKMGYSSVPPGGVGLRDALAAPVDGVLYFAGEATSTIRPASVHGAFESGYRAAREAIQASKSSIRS